MEYHIDRRVILNQDSEFKNLYEWSLQELDAEGKKVGRDQIPWEWGLYFTASEFTLADTIAIEAEDQLASDGKKTAVHERQHIRAKLSPGNPRDQCLFGDTSYSMFGTDRTITGFELYIWKIEDEAEQERCKAWGCVSFTSEVDFRDETTDDFVMFELHVRPGTFARYAEKIISSAVDEVVFRVDEVAGFYSEWSPATATDKIKVLANEKEHKIEMPSESKIDPPRLGKVMKAELCLLRICNLDELKLVTSDEVGDWFDEEETPEEHEEVDQNLPIQKLAVFDPRSASLLSSIRTAAWVIAGVLLLILIT